MRLFLIGFVVGFIAFPLAVGFLAWYADYENQPPRDY